MYSIKWPCGCGVCEAIKLTPPRGKRAWLMMNIVMYIAIGLMAGGLTGFSGSSAVIVVVPALTLGLRMPFREAVGTSLAVDVLTSVMVAITYARSRHVAYKGGGLLIIGAVIGAQSGVLLAHDVPAFWLEWAFGIFALGLSGTFLLHAWRNQPLVAANVALDAGPKSQGYRYLIVGFLGFLIGNVSGLLGASGGIMFLAALVYALRYDLRTAIGTGTAAMALSALSGALGYAWHHELSVAGFIIIGFTAVLTGYAVARATQKLSERVQMGGTGLILMAVGWAMLLK